MWAHSFGTGSKNQANSLKRRHRLTWLFICFRGPRALKDRVESRGPGAENTPVTDGTFMNFRCAGKTGKVV